MAKHTEMAADGTQTVTLKLRTPWHDCIMTMSYSAYHQSFSAFVVAGTAKFDSIGCMFKYNYNSGNHYKLKEVAQQIDNRKLHTQK